MNVIQEKKVIKYFEQYGENDLNYHNMVEIKDGFNKYFFLNSENKIRVYHSVPSSCQEVLLPK